MINKKILCLHCHNGNYRKHNNIKINSFFHCINLMVKWQFIEHCQTKFIILITSSSIKICHNFNVMLRNNLF